MAAPQRVGIYGGTFDPIHFGHLAIAEEARWALDLDLIYLVPAAVQPLKGGGHQATPAQRLAMVELACAANPGLTPSDIELRRAPPSYTVDTLTAFRDQLGPATQIFFVLGADAAVDLPRWHNAISIPRLAHLVVVGRPGYRFDATSLEASLPGLTARTSVINGPMLEISSSDLRRRLATGQPARYQLPDSVLAYIEQNGLYRDAKGQNA